MPERARPFRSARTGARSAHGRRASAPAPCARHLEPCGTSATCLASVRGACARGRPGSPASQRAMREHQNEAPEPSRAVRQRPGRASRIASGDAGGARRCCRILRHGSRIFPGGSRIIPGGCRIIPDGWRMGRDACRIGADDARIVRAACRIPRNLAHGAAGRAPASVARRGLASGLSPCSSWSPCGTRERLALRARPHRAAPMWVRFFFSGSWASGLGLHGRAPRAGIN